MSFITTVDAVKTIIPHQHVTDFLVKNWIIEDKIRNVTIFMQGFLSKDYEIGEALIATMLGFDLQIHIAIQDVENVYYFASTGYEYGTGYNGSPIAMTKDVDFIFKLEDSVLDDVYNVPAYTLALSREFTEQTVYGGNLVAKDDLGYVQYKVAGGNDDENVYNRSLEVLGDKPFFMDSVAQQDLIDAALAEEEDLAPLIQLLATYIVAKDVVTEYILPVFREDIANNLAGVRLDTENLLPGYEEFLRALEDKIADLWALLKYRGKITVNPDGPNGPEDGTSYADIARTVVRGEGKYPKLPFFNDVHCYRRKGKSSCYDDVSPQSALDGFLGSDPFAGM